MTTTANSRQSNRMLRKLCTSMFKSACDAVKPDRLVRQTISVHNNQLHVRLTDGSTQHIPIHQNVHVVAFGKAALGMCRATEDVLGTHMVEGIASVPVGSEHTLRENGLTHLLPTSNSRFDIRAGAANNLPDDAAAISANHVEYLANSLTNRDVLIALVSGGGSALLPAPVRDLPLADKLQCIKQVAGAGANINQLNCVRQNLSRLKNGGLARAAYPARVISLIFSDIIENNLTFVASGPTVPPETSPIDAWHIIEQYKLGDVVPQSVRRCLTSDDSSKQEDCNSSYSHVTNILIGDNNVALQAAAANVSTNETSVKAHVVRNNLVGEAADVGRTFAWALLSNYCPDSNLLSDEQRSRIHELLVQNRCMSEFGSNFVVIFGGETTVTLRSPPVVGALGGRNQEMALAFLLEAATLDVDKHLLGKSGDFTFLSTGTDGQDGPTDVAGVAIDSTDLLTFKQSADEMQHLAKQCLHDNNSHKFWTEFRNGACFIKPGLTGTNVMDIQMLAVQK